MDKVTFEKLVSEECVIRGSPKYHLELRLDGEQVFPQEEVGQGATQSPQINCLSDGEAQGHFWSSEKTDSK